MIENNHWVDRMIRLALEEDLFSGDLTTDAIIDPGAGGKASLVSREEIVLAGLPVFRRVFEILSAEVEFEFFFKDGSAVPAGGEICLLSGPLSEILKGERTALNLLQRMSGIATLTRAYVTKAGAHKARILDTRKTAPGLRLLDKYAVRMGGGFNHRLGLYDGILIKDNHIAAAGSVARAVALAKQNTPHTIKVEVEVEDHAGLEEALQAGADVVLLDNMSTQMMREAVRITGGRALLEASGNIDLGNVEEVAETGVDLISIGALTHSARAVDLSLELTSA